jgi:IrrE N-terminal-like domain
MRQRVFAVLLTLLFTACGPTIQGYPLRRPRPHESRQVAELLDPLLMTLELPSLRIIAASSGCKIGFAIARTDRVNVWSSPATTSPCLYFTLLVTEGALKIPPEQLMATIAHELGHLALHHTPQSDAATLTVSAEHWHAIQAQELEADRFAIALLKRTQTVQQVGSCEAMATFLRLSVPDWYGTEISTRMKDAVTQRAASADAACASLDPSALPRFRPAAATP